MADLLARDDASKPTAEHSHLPFSDAFYYGMRRYYFRGWQPHLESPCGEYVDTLHTDCILEQRTEEKTPSESPASGVENTRSHVEWKRDQSSDGSVNPTADRLMLERCAKPRWNARFVHSNFLFSMGVDSVAEDLLMEVFRRLHPVDRIHSVSLVCRRWHRLVYAKGVWSDVRIWNVNEHNEAAAGDFLLKVSSSLQRLSLKADQSTNLPLRMEHLFHVRMPNLKLLEINSIEAADLACIKASAPRLQSLILTVTDTDNMDLQSLNSYGYFEDLRSLTVNYAESPDIESFLLKRPKLENLRVKCKELSSSGSTASATSSEARSRSTRLKSFRLQCFSDLTAILPLMDIRLENLSFLELVNHGQDGPWDLLALRNLHNVEHLHLSLLGTDDGDCRLLFEEAANASHFPHRLKYLRLSSGWFRSARADQAIEQICKSCPDLRSFRFPAMSLSGTTFASVMLTLRKLEYLFLFRHQNLQMMVGDLGDGAFPELRCLTTVYGDHEKFERELLAPFVLRWPNLIIALERTFVTYRWSNGDIVPNIREGDDVDARIHDTLQSHEGYCCIRF